MTGVTVTGFVLIGTGPPTLADALAIDRVQGFTVQKNEITGNVVNFAGLDTRGSSGLVAGNLAKNNAGINVEGGDASFPATVTVQGNRSNANTLGGVVIVGAAETSTFPTGPGVRANNDILDTVTATVTGNDLSHSTAVPSSPQGKVQPGFGIRLALTLPGQSPLSLFTSVTAAVSKNTMDGNAFGIVIDAGFPFRTDPALAGSVTADF